MNRYERASSVSAMLGMALLFLSILLVPASPAVGQGHGGSGGHAGGGCPSSCKSVYCLYPPCKTQNNNCNQDPGNCNGCKCVDNITNPGWCDCRT